MRPHSHTARDCGCTGGSGVRSTVEATRHFGRRMKAPAFQFYPADWRKDPAVQALGYFERGVWFEILCLMHESNERGVLLLNDSPMPESALANILGLDNQILADSLTKIRAYGVAKVRQSDGALFSKRMVDDERLSKVRRDAGIKGGNPRLLNQSSNQKPTTPVNQNPTPSSASSSSKAKKEPRTKKPVETSMADDFGISPRVEAWAKAKGHTRLAEHLESFRAKCKAKGYTYADWDSAFEGAVRENWAKLAPPAQREVVSPSSRPLK